MKARAFLPAAAVLFAVVITEPQLRAQAPLVTIETVTVGDPGNPVDADVTLYDGTVTNWGSVGYVYNIGKYEVTISQYTAFLNSVARTPAAGHIANLWDQRMATLTSIAGIGRNGSGTQADPYSYSVIGPLGFAPPGAASPGNRPITYISWFEAARFCNWLHNGATNGADTETGAYTLNGATSGNHFTRQPGAKWWIPSLDEWYKAAYFKGGGVDAGIAVGPRYWRYPTQSDTAPGNVIGGATNQANYSLLNVYSVTQSNIFVLDQNYLAEVGAFFNSASAYGTYDQGGNVWEWNDAIFNDPAAFSGSGSYTRGFRGGSFATTEKDLQSSTEIMGQEPTFKFGASGFRVAGLPASTPTANANPGLNISRSAAGTTLTWNASITGPANLEHRQRNQGFLPLEVGDGYSSADQRQHD